MSKLEAHATESQLVSHIAEAAAWYRHAEIIVQQRLYNFLMAASILVLAAATSLSATPHEAQKAVVLTVSIIGCFLSLAYGQLGRRQLKFIDLHMDIIESLEAKLRNPLYRVITPIARLRAGASTPSPLTRAITVLSPTQMAFRSSHFLYVAPFALAMVFFVIMLCGIALPPVGAK